MDGFLRGLQTSMQEGDAGAGTKMMPFHSKCGEKLALINENYTVTRNFIESNRGLLFSESPLKDDFVFIVRIDFRIKAWEGSFELGLTSHAPEEVDLEMPAKFIRQNIWLMSGSSIYINGQVVIEDYGPDLDSLQEGDQIGVMRSSKGDLIFLLNGERLGVAATDLPSNVYAVVTMNGRCVQLSVPRPFHLIDGCVDQVDEDPNNDLTLNSDLDMEFITSPGSKECEDIRIVMPADNPSVIPGVRDKLRFHQRCGVLVHISSNGRTAVRQRPLDDYNNGVVMTYRALYDDELFTVRIDRLVDKWSGGIELGVTSHNPATLRFPSTMTNIGSGTVMMSGGKVLVNGHSAFSDYGNLNLDELRSGDLVGMMRKNSGYLHYYVNGVDQGPATEMTAPQIWGVVDLYGMAVQVTIVDDDDDLNASANSIISRESVPEENESFSSRHNLNEESLLFHSLHNTHVVVINNGKTARRFNAMEFFNHGVVMTNRPLKVNEMFQVRLDLLIQKWVGTVQIGVTTQAFNEAANHFLYETKRSESGTWVLSNNDLQQNGPCITRNLTLLEEGDTVGIMRNASGSLNVYINSIYQGVTKFTVPDNVFGLVDLYGPVAQVTIIEELFSPAPMITPSPGTPISTESNPTIYPDLCFNRVHGSNVCIGRLRTTAYRLSLRPPATTCLLFSSRPLRECEMFEIRIDKTVGFGTGYFEFGASALCPDEMEFSNMGIDTLTDVYTLRGNVVVSEGKVLCRDYKLDISALAIGSKIGLMWHADRSLHFYLDGIDQGKAVHLPCFNIYAIVVLFGRVMQVSVTTGDDNAFNCNGCISENSLLNPKNFISIPPDPFSFSEYRGENVFMSSDYTFAKRKRRELGGALLFSAGYLTNDPFEVKLEACDGIFAGNLRVGLTDTNILNALINRNLPPTVTHMPHYTTYIDGSYLRCTNIPGTPAISVKEVEPSLEMLCPGDKILLKRRGDNSVCVYVNEVELTQKFENVPEKVYAVFELFGKSTGLRALSCKQEDATCNSDPPFKEQIVDDLPDQTLDHESDAIQQEDENVEGLTKIFHDIYGQNIKLIENESVASRCCSYSDGIVVLAQPLSRGQSYKFSINKVTDAYANGLCVGAIAQLPDYLPRNATLLPPPCWILSSEMLINEDAALVSSLGTCLDKIKVGSIVTMHWRSNSKLFVKVDNELPVAFATVPDHILELFAIVDLNGYCEEMSVVKFPSNMATSVSEDQLEETSKIIEVKVEIVREDVDKIEDDDIPSTSLAEAVKHQQHGIISLRSLNKIPIKKYVNETIKRSQSLNSITSKDISEYLEAYKISKTFHGLSEFGRQFDSDVNEAIECLTGLTLNDFNMCGVTEVTPLIKEFSEVIREADDIEQVREEKNHGHEEEQASSIDSEEVVAALVGRAMKWPNLNETVDTLVGDNLQEVDASDSGESSLQPSNEYFYLRTLLLDKADHVGNLEPEYVSSECSYLQSALKYWRELVPDGRRNILRGRVECFCDFCAPGCQDHFKGWVRIITSPSKTDETVASRAYFTVADHSIVINALMTSHEAKHPPSPPDSDAFNATPLCIDYCYALWQCEGGKMQQTHMSLEIVRNSEDFTKDKLKAVLLKLLPSPFHDELIDE